MKNYKINFRKEIEIIRIMGKSNQWLRKLHRFVFNLNIEIVNLEPVVSTNNEIDLEVEEILEAKTVQECVQEIEAKWAILKTVPALQNELFVLLKEGLMVEFHYDCRIKQMLTMLCDSIWSHSAEIQLNQQRKITLEELY